MYTKYFVVYTTVPAWSVQNLKQVSTGINRHVVIAVYKAVDCYVSGGFQIQSKTLFFVWWSSNNISEVVQPALCIRVRLESRQSEFFF